MSDLAASSSPAPARGLPLRLLGDERLARLAAAGSERAFAVLYERHHQALYRYCRTIVRHEQDAQDVLQTTMMRALAALGRGVPDAPMRPWLFRIAHNEAVSVLRRRRPATALDQAPEPEGPALEARVEDRARLTALVADLQALPERQRGALVMRELSGLSHEEIAAALGISVSAAKQAIFDARTGLQEFAKGRAMDCAEVQRIVSERDGRMLRGRPLRAHLRSCDRCRAMRDAIGARRADLAALAPPLPAAAGTGLLAAILGGGGQGGGAAGVAAKVAGGALTAKALAGAAVVATVAIGTVEVARVPSSPPDRSRPAVSAPATPSAPARSTAAANPAAAAAPRPASRSGDTTRHRSATPHSAATAKRHGSPATRHARHTGPPSFAASHSRSPRSAPHPARKAHPATPVRRRPAAPAATHRRSRPAAPAAASRSRRASPPRAPVRPARRTPATPAQTRRGTALHPRAGLPAKGPEGAAHATEPAVVGPPGASPAVPAGPAAESPRK